MHEETGKSTAMAIWDTTDFLLWWRWWRLLWRRCPPPLCLDPIELRFEARRSCLHLSQRHRWPSRDLVVAVEVKLETDWLSHLSTSMFTVDKVASC